MLIGIIGKPSCGKSTFFQAATSIPVERAPRPFTTIKPNHGIGYVEIECIDKEFGVKCNPRNGFCINSRRFVPVDMLDVAGLVPGAHLGKGLGNKFLDDLRQADVLIHIIDSSGSTNEIGEKVAPGSYDPANDVRFVEEELNHWIKGIIDNNWQRLVREGMSKKVEDVIAAQFSGLGISKDAIVKTLKALGLEEMKLAEWNEEEKLAFTKKMREIGKPMVIAANKCDLPHGYENYLKIKKEFSNYLVVPCSAEAEIALKEASKQGFIDYVPGDSSFKVKKELNEQQKKAMEFLKAVLERCGGTGIQKLINTAVFDYLKYVAVFPVAVPAKLSDLKGNVLPDVYLMRHGSTALDLAAAIHTTMAKKFVRAIDVRTRKALSADYVLKHRDVIEITFSR